jgi:hypothetical protein
MVNGGSHNVTVLRASDGSNLGSFNVDTFPQGIVFDGANMWIGSAQLGGVIVKLRTSDGACVTPCSFNAGSKPLALAFDGVNIWVVNNGNANVMKLRASDGTILGTFNPFNPGTTHNLTAMAFDGANMWVVDSFTGLVGRVRVSDGANVVGAAVGTTPGSIAFDGSNMWVVNNGDNTVTKLRAGDAASVGTFTFGTQPRGVAFDGSNIWVTNSADGTVTKRPTLP